jgi:hypothetical protein
MPVHRHLHDKQGSVYAFCSELDTWLAGRRVATAQNEEASSEQPGAGAAGREVRSSDVPYHGDSAEVAQTGDASHPGAAPLSGTAPLPGTTSQSGTAPHPGATPQLGTASHPGTPTNAPAFHGRPVTGRR